MLTEIAMWVAVLTFLVLVVTHPKGFSQSTTTVGDEGNKILGTLSGQGQGTG
jgi:uncharacterized protein YoxC